MRITANKIDGWANTADCRVKLPLLIRKLIHENIKDLSKCKFPSLEQTTSSSGFDGILESNEETQYVPKGVSVWEMGCNKDKSKKRKANEDYKKRKEDPLNTAPKETVYIQVSPRVWKDEKIKEWCDEKNQDNFWKDVILLDAKDLEEWINNTPSVEQWFAEELGFPNEGVQTLSNWWDNWCKTDEFKIHPSLILTDREDDSTRLLNHLTENNNINVKASNLEEGIAFLYSVIDPLEDKDKFLDRCLVIDNKQTLKYYLNSDNLILIPTFDYKEHNDSNNMIYRPLLDSDPSGAEIELEDPQKSSFAKSLENIGIPYHEAKRYAANSGGNITILKRLLSSDITNPEWLNDEYIEVLITIFFMQSWNESEDSIIIEKLSNRSFDDFTQKCEQLLDKADTPLVKINTKWFLKSPKDLLFFISKRITDRHLNRFEEVILKLFDNANKSKFSFNLKRGMSKSMILISVHAENFKRCSKDLQYFIDGIIYNLNEDLSNFWVYNSSFLKFFAEASPQLFITLLKQTLIESPDEITGSTHSRCYINNSSNLLWALERISFDSILFEDIVWILVELSHLPFNKRYIPNPINTLKELFIPWKVNTNTPLDYRIKILKDILTDDFGIGWEILTLLLSRGAEFSFQTSECYWRYTLNLKLTDEDINEYNEHLEDLLLDFAGNNSDRWCFIFEYYKRSSKESKDKILTRFNLIKDNLDDKNTVWNKLRDILGWYSDRFKDKKDFKNEIHAIESLFDELKPSEFIEQISWAFDSGFPRTPEGLYIDRGAKLEEIRNSSIKELFKKQGFEGIRDLINIVKEPQLIANYCLGFDFDDDVINLLNVGESCLNFSGHYIFQKSKDNPNWAMGFVLKVKENNPDKLGIVLIALHSNKETWCIVEDCDSHIQDYYWLNCRQYFGSEISEIEYYMDKL